MAQTISFSPGSGEQRVRELARNAQCIPAELRDKVEKRRGSEIGLDPRYEFFRYKKTLSYAAHAAEMCRRFDAGYQRKKFSLYEQRIRRAY